MPETYQPDWRQRCGTPNDLRRGEVLAESWDGSLLLTTPLTPMAGMVFSPRQLKKRLKAIRRRIKAECPEVLEPGFREKDDDDG